MTRHVPLQAHHPGETTRDDPRPVRTTLPDPFVHLHVASGYSLQYGASHPHVLVERAVEQEMDTLALTDRDGTYGAVRFAKACLQGGLRPVLGVDLAVAPVPASWSGRPRWSIRPGAGRRLRRRPQPPRRRTPVRGGAFRDRALPRVTFLAAGRRGWAAICRLVSATHLAGERGDPVSTPRPGRRARRRARRAGDARAGLGARPGRDAAPRRPRPGRAPALAGGGGPLRPPRRAGLPPVARVRAGLLPARRPDGRRSPGRPGCGVVLTNAVRYADRTRRPHGRRARRRPPPGPARPAPRRPGQRRGLPQVRQADGRGGRGDLPVRRPRVAQRRRRPAPARPHPHGRRPVRARPARRPRPGGGALPRVRGRGRPRRERAGHGTADGVLRARCEAGVGRRYGGAPRQRIWKRLDDELRTIGSLGYAPYFLTVADVTDLIKDMGVRCAARGSGAGSLVNYLLGVSGVDPLRHDLLMERFLSPLRRALPDIDVDVESARRLEVYEAVLDRYGGERCVCVSMMDTYRVRHAVRDVGAALGMPAGRDRRDRQGVPAHPGPGRPGRPARAPRAAGLRARRGAARPAVPARRAARRAAPAHRGAPLRRAALRRDPARPHPGRGLATPGSR